MTYAQILPGNLDKVQIVGQKPSYQGHCQPALGSRIEYRAIPGDFAVAFYGLNDITQGSIDAIHSLDQIIGFCS